MHINGTLNTYGHNDCSNKLILNFSGPLDNGHYDVISYDNTAFQREMHLSTRRKYYALNKVRIKLRA